MDTVKFGNTGLKVSRIALGGASYGMVNYSANWNPYTESGREKAINTIRYALERGINYIDTAPGYGVDRQSEKIMGEAVKPKRDQVIIASKVPVSLLDKKSVLCSVRESLHCLQTDYIDLIQFHGSVYTPEQIDMLMGEPMEALEELRQEGSVRFIGFTSESAASCRKLVQTGRFQAMQITYNITNITASELILDSAQEAGMGITVMRPLASGMFAQLLQYLSPEIPSELANTTALRFVLSDSRVNVINIGMRTIDEVDRNLEELNRYSPKYDMAKFPRAMMELYKLQDKNNGMPWREGENYLQN